MGSKGHASQLPILHQYQGGACSKSMEHHWSQRVHAMLKVMARFRPSYEFGTLWPAWGQSGKGAGGLKRKGGEGGYRGLSVSHPPSPMHLTGVIVSGLVVGVVNVAESTGAGGLLAARRPWGRG